MLISRPRAHLAGWCLIIVISAVVLHASGNGVLGAPPIAHPSSWSQWLETRTAVQAGFAVGRLIAIVATWELALTTVVGALTRLGGAPRLTAAVDRVTAAPLRALLSGAFGLGLMASSLTGAAAFAGGARPPAVETMVRADGPSTETMVREGGVPKTWVVAPGESFWEIAARVETAADGREPSNREIAEFWEALMDANAGRYRNADVIFPGQTFDVPPQPTG